MKTDSSVLLRSFERTIGSMVERETADLKVTGSTPVQPGFSFGLQPFLFLRRYNRMRPRYISILHAPTHYTEFLVGWFDYWLYNRVLVEWEYNWHTGLFLPIPWGYRFASGIVSHRLLQLCLWLIRPISMISTISCNQSLWRFFFTNQHRFLDKLISDQSEPTFRGGRTFRREITVVLLIDGMHLASHGVNKAVDKWFFSLPLLKSVSFAALK